MKIEIIFQDAGDSPDAPQPREMIDMEATFEKLEHELQEVNISTIIYLNWLLKASCLISNKVLFHQELQQQKKILKAFCLIL